MTYNGLYFEHAIYISKTNDRKKSRSFQLIAKIVCDFFTYLDISVEFGLMSHLMTSTYSK
jgi:hypothetical protein